MKKIQRHRLGPERPMMHPDFPSIVKNSHTNLYKLLVIIQLDYLFHLSDQILSCWYPSLSPEKGDRKLGCIQEVRQCTLFILVDMGG